MTTSLFVPLNDASCFLLYQCR